MSWTPCVITEASTKDMDFSFSSRGMDFSTREVDFSFRDETIREEDEEDF